MFFLLPSDSIYDFPNTMRVKLTACTPAHYPNWLIRIKLYPITISIIADKTVRMSS